MKDAPDAVSPGRPVLRYHGGKWKLASWIIGFFPPHRIYVEPFGGAASVLMRKPRSYAEVYNELDGEVTNVFRVLRDPRKAALLRAALELTPFSRQEFEAAYLEAKTPLERARRTIIKSYMGFGSNSIHDPRAKGMRTASSTWRAPTGFRSNSSRSGTTPAHDWSHYPEHLAAFCERLQGVVIESRDAIDVMASHDREDALHYVDPPYVHSTRVGLAKKRHKGRQYAYRHEMSDEQHHVLLTFVKGLSGFVVLSGYDHPIYTEALSGWTPQRRAAMADGARPRTEVLWLSPRTVEAAHSLFSSGAA